MADGSPISQEIRLPTDTEGLASATAKLDAIIARVEKLEHATERQAKRSESQHRKTEQGFDGIGKSIDKARNRAHEFFEFIGAVAALEVLEKIADKFAEIGKEALHSAAMAQRLNFAVDAAAGGKEHGESVRQWMDANAKNSEFSDEQNKAAYLQLKRYGIGDQKAGLFMKGAEDLAAVAGPQEREGVYQEALSAFARVHARGKIDTRSAMRLGIGVEDFATLPQFKGQNRKQISKALLSDKAHVSENDLLNLIMHRTGEQAIGQRAVEASQLLLTRWTKLTQLPERFYEKLGETAAAQKLADAIGGILEKLDPESPTGKKIFAALESTFDSIAETVSEIDFEAVGQVITEDVLPAIKMMTSLLGPTIEAVERIIRGFKLIGTFAVGQDFADRIARVREAEDHLREATRKANRDEDHPAWLDKGKDVGGGAKAWHGPFHMVGEGAGEGYAAGVDAATPDAERSTRRLGKKSHEALKSETETHSPSRKAEEVGGHFGEGFAIGIERSAGRIEDAMDSTMRIPAGAYGGGSSVAGLGAGVQLTIAEGAVQIIIAGADDPAATGAAVRDELAKSIRPMLVDILEEARGGGGG